MGPLVFLESRHSIKGIFTLRTLMGLVWLFPSMDPLVCFENRQLIKGLPTCTALVWLLSSMDALVFLENRQLIKGLPA